MRLKGELFRSLGEFKLVFNSLCSWFKFNSSPSYAEQAKASVTTIDVASHHHPIVHVRLQVTLMAHPLLLVSVGLFGGNKILFLITRRENSISIQLSFLSLILFQPVRIRFGGLWKKKRKFLPKNLNLGFCS